MFCNFKKYSSFDFISTVYPNPVFCDSALVITGTPKQGYSKPAALPALEIIVSTRFGIELVVISLGNNLM